MAAVGENAGCETLKRKSPEDEASLCPDKKQKSEDVPAISSNSSLQCELNELKVSELIKRCKAQLIAEAEINAAQDAETPKQELVALLMARAKQTSAGDNDDAMEKDLANVGESEKNAANEKNVTESGDKESKPSVEKSVEKEPDPFTVFIRNLSPKMTEDQFELDFSEYGDIRNLRFFAYKCMAFVTYASTDSVAEVLKKDGDEYWGRELMVKTASKVVGKGAEKLGNREEAHEVIIKGLPPSMQEEEVRQHFSEQCGEIRSIRVPKKDTGESKGIAFIVFETEESLDKAMELNGKTVKESKIFVNVTEEKGKGKDGKGKDGKGKGKGKGKGGKSKGKGKGKRN